MAKLTEQHPTLTATDKSFEDWLKTMGQFARFDDLIPLKTAYQLSWEHGKNHPGIHHNSCFKQGLEMANILAHLYLDSDTLCAAILSSTAQYTSLPHELVTEKINANTTKLIEGVAKMRALDSLQTTEINTPENEQQTNQLRKMMLAMVDDARVILIKLAERTSIMRAIKGADETTKKRLAQKTLDIYAPLANRLGIIQIKWELEDLALAYLKPDAYKNIATLLAERRTERENRIQRFKQEIQEKLGKAHIKANITGRAKHIYSIHRKMQRKNLAYHEIYDASAIRILVDKLEDCYAALGIIHSTWDYIPSEFDDYVSKPKPNGYQSIHTVIKDDNGKLLEIQIRTHAMHEMSEYGFAAHWKYKENHTEQSRYEEKIARLRQLLDWHKELAHNDVPLNQFHDQVFEDQVYVFTPNNDIISLPKGATPLDFAYQIHSEIGHRCRGAKINNKMVPLTYKLKTGEQVSVLTARNGKPSRDWMDANQGYLITHRARAKVQHWFKQEHHEDHIAFGKQILERELTKLKLRDINFDKLAHALDFKTPENLFAAISTGNIRTGQILQYIQKEAAKTQTSKQIVTTAQPTKVAQQTFSIQGIDNLLTQIAACCKPIPGDSIVGYITQGRGVSIHQKNCINILNTKTKNKERIIDVAWEKQDKQLYATDIFIEANDRTGLVNDITSALINQKINVTSLSTTVNRYSHKANLCITVEIQSTTTLHKLLDKLSQIPSILSVNRYSIGGKHN